MWVHSSKRLYPLDRLAPCLPEHASLKKPGLSYESNQSPQETQACQLPTLQNVASDAPQTRYSTLIFDIGDVLVNWTPVKDSTLPPKDLRRMLVSPTWAKFECGRISEEECYQGIASQLGVEVHDLASSLAASGETLAIQFGALQLHRRRQEALRPRRVRHEQHLCSDFAYIRSKDAPWGVFDEIYTSCQMQERKPDMSFYQKVLSHGSIDPTRTIFVDDKLDNVIFSSSTRNEGSRLPGHRAGLEIVDEFALRVSRESSSIPPAPRRSFGFGDQHRHTTR